MTNTETLEDAEPSKVDSWKMFDRIAPSYDRLNRILSLRRDVAWRKGMAGFLPKDREIDVLDLATGTGDQLLFLRKAGVKMSSAVGMDLSERMLSLGRVKLKQMGLANEIILKTGDTLNIPAEDQVADAVTISFGIRNVTDVPAGLREIHRVIKPGGRLLVLECSMPQGFLLRSFYTFYFRHILPTIGGWVSGDRSAYVYLNRTVEHFPCGKDFCELMTLAGFEKVDYHPQTFGVATIYQGDVPEQTVHD